MNTQRLTSTYYDLTHGWQGFVILYLLIAVFSIIGIKYGRASRRQYLLSPITSLLTLVAVGLSMELLGWIQATSFGIVDERQQVVDHWRDAKSWIVPPIAVSCALIGGGGAGLELLIGCTRLGNLLALLDRIYPLADRLAEKFLRPPTGDAEQANLGANGYS